MSSHAFRVGSACSFDCFFSLVLLFLLFVLQLVLLFCSCFFPFTSLRPTVSIFCSSPPFVWQLFWSLSLLICHTNVGWPFGLFVAASLSPSLLPLLLQVRLLLVSVCLCARICPVFSSSHVFAQFSQRISCWFGLFFWLLPSFFSSCFSFFTYCYYSMIASSYSRNCDQQFPLCIIFCSSPPSSGTFLESLSICHMIVGWPFSLFMAGSPSSSRSSHPHLSLFDSCVLVFMCVLSPFLLTISETTSEERGYLGDA